MGKGLSRLSLGESWMPTCRATSEMVSSNLDEKTKVFTSQIEVTYYPEIKSTLSGIFAVDFSKEGLNNV